MGKFRFLTSGESHGPGLNIIVEGLPSNLRVLREDLDFHLARRQGGYGRGARMKIEKDRVKILAGIRHGKTLGSPISLLIENKDYQNWKDIMNPDPLQAEKLSDPTLKKKLQEKLIHKVRPGHADFPGSIKYNFSDVRNSLERSSARETTSRVAAGSLARKFLEFFGIKIYSQVVQIGSVKINPELIGGITTKEFEAIEQSALRCKDPEVTQKMKVEIDHARKKGESLGGIVELIAYKVPLGLGSHVHWDRRIDGLISQAILSIHTVKAIGFGSGFEVADLPGSQVHDQIQLKQESRPELLAYEHLSNRAGGIEGGITNGEPIVCKIALKPIPTLARRENLLKSVNLENKTNDFAFYERSDVCVVPAGGVVCESMLAIVLADQILGKFGGDSIEETERNYQSYLDYCLAR